MEQIAGAIAGMNLGLYIRKVGLQKGQNKAAHHGSEIRTKCQKKSKTGVSVPQ